VTARDALVKGDPCWDCDDKKYAGNGVYECAAPGGTCQKERDIEWLTGLVGKVADAIAADHTGTRELREEAATYLSDALADLLYDHRCKLGDEAFMRRADVPKLREKA